LKGAHAANVEAAEIQALKDLLEAYPLLGAIETAEMLCVTVSNLDDVGGLPAPALRVRASRLWIAAEIEAFVPILQARRAARRQRRLESV
jgi:hypothetical protein